MVAKGEYHVRASDASEGDSHPQCDARNPEPDECQRLADEHDIAQPNPARQIEPHAVTGDRRIHPGDEQEAGEGNPEQLMSRRHAQR